MNNYKLKGWKRRAAWRNVKGDGDIWCPLCRSSVCIFNEKPAAAITTWPLTSDVHSRFQRHLAECRWRTTTHLHETLFSIYNSTVQMILCWIKWRLLKRADFLLTQFCKLHYLTKCQQMTLYEWITESSIKRFIQNTESFRQRQF